jgi:hypothetical protein
MLQGVSDGRTWWAHFEFTRIDIEPIILKNKIEDVREAGAAPLKRYGVPRALMQVCTRGDRESRIAWRAISD